MDARQLLPRHGHRLGDRAAGRSKVHRDDVEDVGPFGLLGVSWRSDVFLEARR
jgi:hypothetical protein